MQFDTECHVRHSSSCEKVCELAELADSDLNVDVEEVIKKEKEEEQISICGSSRTLKVELGDGRMVKEEQRLKVEIRR